MAKGFDVDIAAYCEDCENFIPEVHRRTFGNNMTGYKTYNDIYCRYKTTCAHIYKHLERKLKEKENE